MDTAYDYLSKIIFIGNSGVGKSCLLLRATDNTFTESYMSTIGADFKIKTIEVDGKVVKNQFWDTAGQERFRTISAVYYKGANVIILVFDITDVESFENLPSWHEQVKSDASDDVKILVVGNKVDLKVNRKVSYEDAAKYAKEIGAGYLETSAKTGYKVDEMLLTVTRYGIRTLSATEDIQLEKAKNESNENTLENQSDISTTTTTTTTTQGQKLNVFKIVIVGETHTGKSCILLQYTDGKFKEKYEVTVGVEFTIKSINFGENSVKLQIWDLAGQESFRSITRSYYKGSHGVILVYDITKKVTFDKLKLTYEDVKENTSEGVKFMLVGNKKDLESKREVSYEDGKRFAEEIGAGFLETSAKSNENIEDVFSIIAGDIMSSL